MLSAIGLIESLIRRIGLKGKRGVGFARRCDLWQTSPPASWQDVVQNALSAALFITDVTESGGVYCNVKAWESHANPSALGAEERQFKSGCLDHHLDHFFIVLKASHGRAQRHY